MELLYYTSEIQLRRPYLSRTIGSLRQNPTRKTMDMAFKMSCLSWIGTMRYTHWNILLRIVFSRLQPRLTHEYSQGIITGFWSTGFCKEMLKGWRLSFRSVFILFLLCRFYCISCLLYSNCFISSTFLWYLSPVKVIFPIGQSLWMGTMLYGKRSNSFISVNRRKTHHTMQNTEVQKWNNRNDPYGSGVRYAEVRPGQRCARTQSS